MIKEIKYKNKVVAIVYRYEGNEDNINFLSSPDNSFQIGILNHPLGHVIPAHIHNKIKRTINETQEMLYVEAGRMKVFFYDKDNKAIAEEILLPGDLVNLISEAHGFEFLEKSRIIYVKQGPYTNKKKDKKIL